MRINDLQSVRLPDITTHLVISVNTLRPDDAFIIGGLVKRCKICLNDKKPKTYSAYHIKQKFLMKTAVLFFIFISVSAFAQVKLPTSETGQVQYQEIVRLGDGKGPARPVFDQIRTWARQQYPLANEAELHYDQQHGIVFVRSLYAIGNYSIRYTLTVEARIGRYRATITDLVAEQGGLIQPVRAVSTSAQEMERAAADSVKNSPLIKQIADDQAELYQQIDAACRTTLANLKQSMQEPATRKDE